MPNPVLLEKLNSVAHCIERLESKKTITLIDLKQNHDFQDIMILNLQRIIQLCVDISGVIIAEKGLTPIPSTMTETFDILCQHKIIPPQLRDHLKKAVAIRNLVLHEYEKIKWDVVYNIITQHINMFRDFGRLVDKIAR